MVEKGLRGRVSNLHSARTRGFSLMKAGKVSAFKSWTSDAEATAAAPMSPKAMFLKLRILAAEGKGLKTSRVLVLVTVGTKSFRDYFAVRLGYF